MVIKTHETFWRAETKLPELQVAVNCLWRGCRIAQDLSSCCTGFVFSWEGGDEGR